MLKHRPPRLLLTNELCNLTRHHEADVEPVPNNKNGIINRIGALTALLKSYPEVDLGPPGERHCSA